MYDRPRFDLLTRDCCVELLASTPVGRVVFTDHALPAVRPVTFVLDRDAVVIRTRRNGRLARAAHDAVLAFEVDEIDPAQRSGWSVVVTGHAQYVDDVRECERLDGLLRPWAPGVRDLFIRIPMTLLSGRRIVPVGVARQTTPVG